MANSTYNIRPGRMASDAECVTQPGFDSKFVECGGVIMTLLLESFERCHAALAAVVDGVLTENEFEPHLKMLISIIESACVCRVGSGRAIAAKFKMADWSLRISDCKSLSLNVDQRDRLITSAMADLKTAHAGVA